MAFWWYMILFCFILLYFILFYFILFYFILFVYLYLLVVTLFSFHFFPLVLFPLSLSPSTTTVISIALGFYSGKFFIGVSTVRTDVRGGRSTTSRRRATHSYAHRRAYVWISVLFLFSRFFVSLFLLSSFWILSMFIISNNIFMYLIRSDQYFLMNVRNHFPTFTTC